MCGKTGERCKTCRESERRHDLAASCLSLWKGKRGQAVEKRGVLYTGACVKCGGKFPFPQGCGKLVHRFHKENGGKSARNGGEKSGLSRNLDDMTKYCRCVLWKSYDFPHTFPQVVENRLSCPQRGGVLMLKNEGKPAGF